MSITIHTVLLVGNVERESRSTIHVSQKSMIPPAPDIELDVNGNADLGIVGLYSLSESIETVVGNPVIETTIAGRCST